VTFPGVFYVHTAVVETSNGFGAYGDTFDAPYTLPCFVDDGSRLVLNSAGEQVVSTARLFTYPAHEGRFVPNSRVTVNGRVSRVVATHRRDSGALRLPDHIEVELA
jgi:hypothetical protein